MDIAGLRPNPNAAIRGHFLVLNLSLAPNSFECSYSRTIIQTARRMRELSSPVNRASEVGLTIATQHVSVEGVLRTT